MQMATQLRMIRRGERPVTKARLGPPIALHHLNATTGSPGHPKGGKGGNRSPPCIDNDGTAFSDAFRRRGRRPAGDDEDIGTHHRIRAKEVANMLQLFSNGSDIRSFLTEAEQSDPELVDFWTETTPLREQVIIDDCDVTMGRSRNQRPCSCGQAEGESREPEASRSPQPGPPGPREPLASSAAGESMNATWHGDRKGGSPPESRGLGWRELPLPTNSRELRTRPAPLDALRK